MTIDNFTLLVCLCTAALLLAFAFAGVWSAQRRIRAPLYFSLAFFAGAIGCVLFLLPPRAGEIFRFLNIVVGDTCICLFLVILQAGIRSYLGITRYRHRVWLPLVGGSAALLYYTQIHDSLFARIIILGIVGVVVRVQIGIDLIARAPRRSYRILAGVMFFFAVVSLWQVLGTVVRGAPREYFLPDLVQSSVLFLYLIFLIATGLLLFLLNNDELVRRLEEEAAKDYLTGTFNRRGIERVLSVEIERNRRTQEPISVAVLDIDSFKAINDQEGHAEGDRVVQEIARLALHTLRPYDSVGRLGGDEFVIVLPGTAAEAARHVAERLRECIAGTLSGVTVSIGVATSLKDESQEEVLARADSALYAAKGSGRDCVRSAE